MVVVGSWGIVVLWVGWVGGWVDLMMHEVAVGLMRGGGCFLMARMHGTRPRHTYLFSRASSS